MNSKYTKKFPSEAIKSNKICSNKKTIIKCKLDAASCLMIYDIWNAIYVGQ